MNPANTSVASVSQINGECGANLSEQNHASVSKPIAFPQSKIAPNRTKPSPKDGESAWPEPMRDTAFYGLAGDFIRLVEPETEADPAALLLAFLVGFGCMVGRSPFYQTEATRQGVNLFSVIVGDTSKARKGTATDRAIDILKWIDPEFIANRKRSGLSSGEGLIQAVRDEREEDVPVKERGMSAPRFERQVVDTGEQDKRLLAVESEFGSVLRQGGREGNILSTILREAWDGKPLQVVARSNKDSCKEPHISVIANITIEELQRLLTSCDRANGFGNRILWCCARRSKLLPHGGKELDAGKLAALVTGLRSALECARLTGQVQFDPEAYNTWDGIYRQLAEGGTGLFGSMTARGETQVLRLAMLYALLDSSNLIRIEHLQAAQEVWRYCEDSVRYIFGDALGDETADSILRMLKNASDGLTQTQISKSFYGHKSSVELFRALTLLTDRGKLTSQTETTGGAPVTLWKLKKVWRPV